jgi:hypothetical protein
LTAPHFGITAAAIRSVFPPAARFGPASSQEEKSMTNDNQFGPIIYAYTRTQALADGVLALLPRAQVLGFTVPVACTEAVWNTLIDWDETDPALAEIQAMRETAVLTAALHEVKALARRQQIGDTDEPADRIYFVVEAFANDGTGRLVETSLWMMIGPGDTAEPVGTIMLIGED